MSKEFDEFLDSGRKEDETYNEWAKSNEWIRALDFLQIASTLAQNNPNDQDLGRKIRSLLKSTEL
jgi:hypothetical protein